MKSRRSFFLVFAALWILLPGCGGAASPTGAPAPPGAGAPTEITVIGSEPSQPAPEAAATGTDPASEATEGDPGAPVETAAPAPPTPTPGLPPPFQGESIMGIELIGEDFGTLAGVAANAGAHWIRWNAVHWSAIEPSPGFREWSALVQFDQQILSLAAADLVPIVIVRSTPPWAQAVPGSLCGPILPDALDEFALFMHDLVARYSVPPYNIKYWELWNEPDVDPTQVPSDQIFGCWGDKDDPFFGGGGYAEMLKLVYPSIKQADPQSQVLVGGLLLDCDPNNPPETSPGSGVLKDCAPSRFLEGILENGGGDFFDGVSFHAYDFYETISGLFGNPNWHSGYTLSGLNPVVVPKTRFIKSVLATYGYSNKYLINTETSLLCGRFGDEPECNTGAHLAMKTDYVVMSYASAVAEGLAGNVWFTLDRSWRRSALTEPGGAPTTALMAYNFASLQFDGASFWGNVGEFPGVNGYKFRRGELEFWVVWSADGQQRTIELAALPSAVYDSTGTPLSPAQSVEITVSPVYLVFEP